MCNVVLVFITNRLLRLANFCSLIKTDASHFYYSFFLYDTLHTKIELFPQLAKPYTQGAKHICIASFTLFAKHDVTSLQLQKHWNLLKHNLLNTMASRFSFYSFPGYEFLISTMPFFDININN